MKLITYVRMGKVGFGIIKNGGIIELNDRIENDVTSIKSLLKKNKQKKAQDIYKEMNMYNCEAETFQFTTSKYLPNVEKFLTFWSDNITYEEKESFVFSCHTVYNCFFLLHETVFNLGPKTHAFRKIV